jgi:single-strand DNA-binding protein
MPNLNKVILAGHVGGQPEVKQTQRGGTWVKFSIATKRGFKQDAKTDWHSVACFGDAAKVAQTLQKGLPVTVTGSLEYSQTQDGKKFASIKAESVMAHTPRQRTENQAYQGQAQQPPQGYAQPQQQFTPPPGANPGQYVPPGPAGQEQYVPPQMPPPGLDDVPF